MNPVARLPAQIRIAYSMTEDFVLKYAWSAAGYVIIAAPTLLGHEKTSTAAEGVAATAAPSIIKSSVAGKTESEWPLGSADDATLHAPNVAVLPFCPSGQATSRTDVFSSRSPTPAVDSCTRTKN